MKGVPQKKLAPRQSPAAPDVAAAVAFGRGGCWIKKSVWIFYNLTRVQF